jgi:Flp pilus assembly protein TadD
MKLVGEPQKRHWGFYYSRGTCYERTKQWPKAEADLKKAMTLSPEQPLVLNYLGYSWIDQGQNLKQGLALIKKAVSLKPDDGYIVDSLGWAYFKLGRYQDSVGQLERAVELRPDDPVLNDHLGDALWRVGREREARYQWEQALSLKPEPEDEQKIRKKLLSGLAIKAEAKAQPRKSRSASTDQRRSKTGEAAPSPTP